MLQIYRWICQWKNFGNRLRNDRVTAMSLVSSFLGTQCRIRWWVWRWCSGVAGKRQTRVGYFVCEEGSKAVGDRDTCSRDKEDLRCKSLFTVCQRRLRVVRGRRISLRQCTVADSGQRDDWTKFSALRRLSPWGHDRSKRNIYLPYLHFAPPLGRSHRNFINIFSVRNQESFGSRAPLLLSVW